MSTCTRCKREVASDARFCPFCGAAAPPAAGMEPGDPWIGQTVAGKYLVHELIDRGGMGVVYKATHLALDRPIALKVLNRELLADPTLAARFHREARAASRLNHPNSIGVIDFGQTDDGALFMALEYLPGRNLARVLAEEFPLGAERVVKIGSQILAALTEAHALGIVHCDIKPENVMLETRHDERDVVKVLDFGIAKLRDAGSPRLTREGMVCGTPGYSSPEQARGEELDARSDLYSVGVVLYELLAGKLPYDAATPGALMAKMLVEPPVPLHVRRPDLRVEPELEAAVMRALSLDREGRHTSADHFRRDLLACVGTSERPKRTVAKPQGTAIFGAAARPRSTPGQAPTAGHGRPPTRQRTPGTTAKPPTPRERPASRTPHPAAREAMAAMGLTAASVVGALLIGGIVWYALTSFRGGSDDAIAARLSASPDPLAAPRVTAAPPPAPAPQPTAAPVDGILAILVAPGAQIAIDGEPAGRAPREVRLSPGRHRIRATHPDLGVAEGTVEVIAGQRTLWNGPLAR